MSQIQTKEVHTKLNELQNKLELGQIIAQQMDKEITDKKYEVKQLQRSYRETLTNIKYVKHELESHTMIHENMRVYCEKCGFVQSILEDIKN